MNVYIVHTENFLTRNAGRHKPNIISVIHKMFVIYNKERKTVVTQTYQIFTKQLKKHTTQK